MKTFTIQLERLHCDHFDVLIYNVDTDDEKLNYNMEVFLYERMEWV